MGIIKFDVDIDKWILPISLELNLVGNNHRPYNLYGWICRQERKERHVEDQCSNACTKKRRTKKGEKKAKEE